MVVFDDNGAPPAFPVQVITIRPRSGKHPPPLMAYIGRDAPADIEYWEPYPGVRITRHDGYRLEPSSTSVHTAYPSGGNFDVGDSSDVPLVVIVLPSGWAAIVPPDPDNLEDPPAIAHLHDDGRLILAFSSDELVDQPIGGWWKTHWLMYKVETCDALVRSRGSINAAFRRGGRRRRPAGPRQPDHTWDPTRTFDVIGTCVLIALAAVSAIVGALGPDRQTRQLVLYSLAVILFAVGVFLLVRTVKLRGWRLRGVLRR